jgi:hypothetical protein
MKPKFSCKECQSKGVEYCECPTGSNSTSLTGSMPVHSARDVQKLYPDCPLSVPMILLNEEWAQKNHSQTLKRLAERGGLDPTEIMANVERRPWHRMNRDDAIKQVNKLLA